MVGEEVVYGESGRGLIGAIMELGEAIKMKQHQKRVVVYTKEGEGGSGGRI